MLVHGKVRAILRIRRNLVVRYKHKVQEFFANSKNENRRKPVQISQTVRISRTMWQKTVDQETEPENQNISQAFEAISSKFEILIQVVKICQK